MKTIWKYTLAEVDEQLVTMPKGSELLSVQVQNDGVQLWALVDTSEQKWTNARIIIHGTGHPANDIDGMKFLGTFQLFGGSFVGHCWGSMTPETRA